MNTTKKKSISTILGVLAIMLITPFMLMLGGCSSKLNIKEVGTQEALVQAIADEKIDEVKLTSDIIIDDTLVISRKVIINLNGKTISNTKDIWVDTETEDKWSLISVRVDANLTITGNGKLLAKENDCYALDVVDGGKLTIEDGEFIGNISAVYIFEGSAEIKGGKYSIKQLNTNGVESAYGCTINVYNQNQDANKASVSITGGIFANFNPTDKTQNAHDNLVPEGYKAVLVEGSTTDYQVVKA